MTIGSLFSGIGGLELGLESCGLGPVIWQCDSDPHARAVLAAHWPSVHRYGDVKEIDASAPPPEIICGGFPCQDISLAGKGAGIDGARSGLWSEFARIIRALRPVVVFVENVAALVNRGLDRVLGDLAALGFDAEWDVFRASDVGAPHRRERLFLLAYSDGERVRQFAERGSRGGAGERATERQHAEPVHDRETLADADRAGREGMRKGEPSRPRRPDAAELRAGDVADAAGARRAIAQDSGTGGGDEDARSETQGRRAARSEQPQRDGGGALANTDGIGRELVGRAGLLNGEWTPPGDDAHGCHGAYRFPPGPSAITGWDGTQPAIRKCHDGVPRGLDGAIDGTNSKRGPTEDLRALRESVPSGSLQRRLGRRVSLREAPILFEGLLGARTTRGLTISFSDAETNRQNEEAIVREVRRAFSAQQSPQRSELAEQRSNELGNALLVLSHLVAPRSERDPSVNASVIVFCLWKAIVSARSLRDPPHSLQEVWRPDNYQEVARWILGACRGYLTVAKSDRLRLLGNSVVQQQAALAWRTLIARARSAHGARGAA
jgi:site-specific DNA-cytosine methylase